MVEAVSQVKPSTTSAPVSEIKKDTVAAKPTASNLERTPEEDSVSVNGKEKTEGKKKNFTGWLIGAGVAIVGTGIYFLTRGKKGSKAVNEAAHEAVQTVKKNVNDTVHKVEDAVTTAVRKEEPKVKKQEVLTPDKITVTENKTPKPNPKEEFKQNAETATVIEETPRPATHAQSKEPKPENIPVKKEEPVEILQQKIPEKTKVKDFPNPHTDDYLNINGIADDVLDLNNHGMKEHFSDLISPLDDYDTPLVENIFDIGGDFLDGVS